MNSYSKPTTIVKNGFSYQVEWDIDQNPDLSWLGKYSNKFQPYCVDRKTGYLLGDKTEKVMTQDEYAVWRDEFGEYEYGSDYNEDGLTITVYYYPVLAKLGRLDYHASRDYRYIVGTQHLPSHLRNWSHVSAKDIRKCHKNATNHFREFNIDPKLNTLDISIPLTEALDVLSAAEDYYLLEQYGNGQRWMEVCTVNLIVDGEKVDYVSLSGIDCEESILEHEQHEAELIAELEANIAKSASRFQEIANKLKGVVK